MKKNFLLILFLLVTAWTFAQQNFSKPEVKAIMKRVADWQIANPNKGAEHDDLDWTHAALYMGMVDWAELTEKEDNDNSYYKWLLKIGQRNHFQVGKWMYHADFIAVGQPFIDLYIKYGNKKMVAPVMARANWVVENPAETTLELDYSKLETLDRWSWCDALFMAPPVYAKLYALTKNKKYLDFLNKEYKATYEYLYDKEEQLFYRDRRYFGKKEAMVRRYSGDVVTAGYLVDCRRFCKYFLKMNLPVSFIKICLSLWLPVLQVCKVRMDIGMPVCLILYLILLRKPVRQVLLSMHLRTE